MKKAIPLLVLLLCACTANVTQSGPPGYSERQIATVAESEVQYQGDEEDERASSERLESYITAFPEQFPGMRHESCDDVRLPKDGPCEVYRAARIEIMNGRTDVSGTEPLPEQWAVYANKKLLFIAPMYFAADGPVLERRIVAGKPAVTFRRDLRVGTIDEAPALADVPIDTFYDGAFLSDRYWIEGSHGLFAYKNILGFVGKQEGKEYVFFNGKPVTPAFDAIRTFSCCTVPHTDLRVYGDGMLYFSGERGEHVYRGEVDLDAFLDAELPGSA